MRLRIELFPADLDATIAFYSTALGFTIERREPGYATVVRDGVRIGAAVRPPVPDDGARRPPTGVEIVLEVSDLAAERERVRRSGWPVADEVTERPWGLTDFRVLDPDGYYLRITTA